MLADMGGDNQKRCPLLSGQAEEHCVADRTEDRMGTGLPVPTVCMATLPKQKIIGQMYVLIGGGSYYEFPTETGPLFVRFHGVSPV